MISATQVNMNKQTIKNSILKCAVKKKIEQVKGLTRDLPVLVAINIIREVFLKR